MVDNIIHMGSVLTLALGLYGLVFHVIPYVKEKGNEFLNRLAPFIQD